MAAKPCCGTAAPSYPPPPPLGDRIKSDASHLPLLLRDGDNRTRSQRQGDYERGGGKPGERRARWGGGGEGPPAPERQRCPSRREGDIDTASATSQRQRTYAITAPPGERRAQGGGGRGAHAATRLTPPVDARAIDAVLNKMKKRLTWQWRRAGEDNSYGG